MPFVWRPQSVLLLAVLAVAGCSTPMPKGKSPLMPAQMSPNSVVLEMFFVRFPFGDATVNEKLWEQIDEQQFSSEMRDRLARNGLRVGLVHGQIPTELSQLLQLSDKPAPGGETQNVPVEHVEAEPRVVRRHLQLPAGQRSEILASGVYPELPMLMCDAGRLSGQTYHQAQCIFGARTLPQPDGSVRLELTPELHHDQPQQRWVGSHGMMRLETGRPKRTFDDLILSTDLDPGSMLVLSSLPNRPGSLGHYFFTETKDGRVEQKLLIVRLSQTQHDGLFAPPEPLDLDQ